MMGPFFLSLAFAAALASLASAVNPNCPDGMHVRQEFRDLSRYEWLNFKDALDHLYSTTIDGSESFIDRFTRVYLENVDIANDTIFYLPWHRQFALMFENELRRYNSSVSLPYWAWEIEPRNALLLSPLFKDAYLGMYPRQDCRYRLRYPSPHCLNRDYDSLRFGPFYDSKAISYLINDSRASFEAFSNVLEGAPHASVYSAVGGRKGQFSDMTSPNDAIFWLHRSQIDRIWHAWQQMRLVYGRDSGEFGGVYYGRWATSAEVMKPFGIQVAQVLHADQQLCYVYSPPRNHAIPLALYNTDANDSIKWQPAPIPEELIRKHGHAVEKVRDAEALLLAAMTAPTDHTAPPAA